MQSNYTRQENVPHVRSLLYLISLITLAFILITETSYSQSLFDKSLDDIVAIQAGRSDAGVTMMQLYSNLGVAVALLLPIVLSFLVFHERVRAFYYTVMVTCFLMIMNIGKLYYH